PGEGGLNNEVYHWLACQRPTAGHQWADVSLELLTLDALCRRDDAILSVFHEQANERARAIVSSRTWSLACTAEPGSVSIANQLHFLLARKCALANGWAEEIDASIVSALIKQHDADITAQEDPKLLWAAASTEIDSEHFRNVSLIAAILGIASED